MSIESDTDRFEAWLRKQCKVVEPDLKHKHKKMCDDPFVFLRATYYRWARKIDDWCPEAAEAPRVLSVGDVHTENFGTWRDSEGRLVWGINDFDEAAVMPYTLDLVRLATSAALAPGRRVAVHAGCGAILDGYRRGLAEPRPTLLDEKELWMRSFVAVSDDERKAFWKEVDDYPDVDPPRKVARGFAARLPKHAEVIRFCTRRKGGGGLGRPRYVVVAAWRGGRIVREAKALVPSAWHWARKHAPGESQVLALSSGRFRSPDPWFDVDDSFIYRRVAADSHKIELGKLAGTRLDLGRLRAMGFDLGAIHAAHERRRDAILPDLKRRPRGWLEKATKDAAAAVTDDFEAWRKSYKSRKA